MESPGTPFVLNYPCFVLMARATAPFVMLAGKDKCIVLFTDSDLMARFRAGLERESGDPTKYAQMGALQFTDRSALLDTLRQLEPQLKAHGTTRIALNPTVGGKVKSVGIGEFIAAFERL